MATESESSSPATTAPTSGRWFVDPDLHGPERARWILAECEDGTRYLLAQVFSHEPATERLEFPPGKRDANAAVMAAAKGLATGLHALVDQVSRCNPVDEHGHRLVMNLAFLRAEALLATLPTLTTLQGEI